jgi:regulatory protein
LAFGRNRTRNTLGRAGAARSRPARDRDLFEDLREPSAENKSDRREAIRSDGDKVVRKVMAAAVKMLAARPRSERDLRERLLAKELAAPEVIDGCLARLKELGYVNDRLFAYSYARSRVGLKGVGRSRLARELAVKKVAREAIESALDTVFEEQGEEALIDRAIEKRIRTHGRPADQPGARRLFAHLARLGFEYDLIIRKLHALKLDEE